MDKFTTEDLKILAEATGDVFVSIYAPMYRAGKEVSQNEIRFKNLIDNAEKQLEELGHDTAILDEARRLQSNSEFWQHQAEGLAVFCCDGFTKHYRVAISFDETVVVGQRPHVKPLSRIFTDDNQWYILAASLQNIRLMIASPHSVQNLELDVLPENLRDALNIDEYVSTLQHHTTSTGGKGQSGHDVMHHGQGGGEPENRKKDEILQYFHKLDRALGEYFGIERTPMVFAGVEYLFPIFQEACQYNGIVDEAVEGNPDDFSPQELQEKTWNIIKPRLQQQRAEFVEQFCDKSNTAWASDDLMMIYKAARMGQVETLLVQDDFTVWATFDNPEEPVQVDSNAAEAEDIVNRIVVQTLINGGTVFNLSEDEMPTLVSAKLEIAASFRSPVESYVS